MAYDEVKEFEGESYTGMAVGGRHTWRYTNAIWREVKVAPDVWDFTLTSMKEREHAAPEGSGAGLDTQYHWYVLAHQFVRKIDADRYSTFMSGLKYKVAHKRPHWRAWNTRYQDGADETERVLAVLDAAASQIRERGSSSAQVFPRSVHNPPPLPPQRWPASRRPSAADSSR